MSPTGLARAIAFLRVWGISIASAVGGLLTLFVFRRGLPHVSLIVGYVLLLWILVAVLVQTRNTWAASDRRTHRLALAATEYTVQTLYHGVLLFLLPAYWAATTLTSYNVVFFLLLVFLALLATVDPWYHTIVHPHPWMGYLFFVVSLFGALNLALPLVYLPPAWALLSSAWLATVALTPAVCRARAWPWRLGFAVTALVGFAVAAGVVYIRIAIPPAPLFLAQSRVAWDVGTPDSPQPPSPIPAAALESQGLVAHTAIYAPAGLRTPVQHVWRQNGVIVNVIPLTVEGGRQQGYRTFSRKHSFPANPAGRWTVDVLTRGQLIGRLRFRVSS
ncbi:MAG TPA: DUF5924 family protein [Methylomirabilota bacterium]|nr:DUF5924 family protein [Methylomirabilota bacterium]